MKSHGYQPIMPKIWDSRILASGSAIMHAEAAATAPLRSAGSGGARVPETTRVER